MHHKNKRTIVCTVTNDLVYDQRMRRICTALTAAGYDVLLLGRRHSASPALLSMPFRQKRFRCWFTKGLAFYAEYNIKLFFILLFTKAHCFCAIDLDSILPNYFASVLRGKPRVYDAHELFCEMQEITSRPHVYKVWKAIEKFCVPRFKNGYTIGDCYAAEFKRLYNVHYQVVRNATVYNEANAASQKNEPTYILYQGAVNEGRSFETLIPAMQHVDCKLVICGKGNFFEQTKALIEKYNLQHRVELKGYIAPSELKAYTSNAYIGITLFSDGQKSMSNYYSLGNRFFDYMHAGLPQVCVAYPEYVAINKQYSLAVLVSDLQPETIASAINSLLGNEQLYAATRQQAILASQRYSWQEEEKTLIEFYQQLFA